MRRSISVVVPVYNSRVTLAELVHRLHALLVPLGGNYEIVLVNDGSRDGSWEEICRLAGESRAVVGINLVRNFGQHSALLCGVRQARNEIVVTMDDDLQHPPEEIPKLLKEIDRGFDVVYGAPRAEARSALRAAAARVLKIWLKVSLGIAATAHLSPFRAFRAEIRSAFADYQGPQALLDLLLARGTSKFGVVRVECLPRKVGSSNYTLGKLFGLTIGTFRAQSSSGTVEGPLYLIGERTASAG